MSSDEPGRYRLAPRALVDLEDIWRYTAEQWSLEQVDRYVDELTQVFQAIAALPMLARERTEFDPPVRIHVHGSHLVVYAVYDDHVAILRLLGGRQDWVAILNATEP